MELRAPDMSAPDGRGDTDPIVHGSQYICRLGRNERVAVYEIEIRSAGYACEKPGITDRLNAVPADMRNTQAAAQRRQMLDTAWNEPQPVDALRGRTIGPFSARIGQQ